MSSTVEMLENNEAELTITVDADIFENGMQAAYEKNKQHFSLPGFRKGRVPRQMVEAQFGKETLYDDAVEYVFPRVYPEAIEKHDLEVVSRPDLTNMDVKDDGSAVLEVKVVLMPEASIKNYKGLTYTKEEVEVKQEEIDAEIEKQREQNARMLTIEDRAIEDGDIAVIDYKGFVDGEAFEGGEDTDFELTIGSNSFIDDFEEQLIGKEAGEETEVNVTFPEEYHAEDLAGKEATFEVKIHEIRHKELPEVDDDFAMDISEFDTIDEYTADLEANLLAHKEQEAERMYENQVMEKLAQELECDIPEVMIENQLDGIVNDFAQRLQQQGMQLEMYLQYLGQDMNTFRESHRATAEMNVKLRLALEEVAKEEELEITPEEFNEEMEKMSEMYQIDIEQIEEMLQDTDKEQIHADLLVQKSIKVVMAEAVEVEAEEEDKEETEED